MNEINIEKLRRFSLLFGLLLFAYSVAGVVLDAPAKISPLGIPMIIKRPDLLGLALIGGSIYGLFRYWFYAIQNGLSPRKARSRLLRGEFPHGKTIRIHRQALDYDYERSELKNKALRDVQKYFPILPWKKEIDIEIKEFEGCWKIEKFNVPLSSRILGLICDFDYYLPVLVNIAAIIFYSFR